jgi:hypothetical protein
METNGNRAKLYAKIKAVYQDVNYIQKDKRNNFHGYSYASEAAIKDHLHEAFVKHGLVMLPPDVESVEDAKKTNEKGKEEIITTAKIRFGIADVETGEEIRGTLFGRGVDASDKGIYKAITGGLKYFLTTTFLIPTGDDPEEDEQPKATKQQPAAKPQAQPQQTAQSAAKPSSVPKPPFDAKSAQTTIAAFEKQIGRDKFMRVLGSEGVTAVSEITVKEQANRIYGLLQQEMKVMEPVHA